MAASLADLVYKNSKNKKLLTELMFKTRVLREIFHYQILKEYIISRCGWLSKLSRN